MGYSFFTHRGKRIQQMLQMTISTYSPYPNFPSQFNIRTIKEKKCMRVVYTSSLYLIRTQFNLSCQLKETIGIPSKDNIDHTRWVNRYGYFTAYHIKYESIELPFSKWIDTCNKPPVRTEPNSNSCWMFERLIRTIYDPFLARWFQNILWKFEPI